MKRLLALGILGWALAGLTIPGQASQLHDAVENSDMEKVTAILEKSPDLLDARDDAGLTPLNLAAKEGSLDIFKYLLSQGADMELGDLENSKPMHNAAIGGDTDIVDILLAKGAKIDERDKNDTTPLHFAVQYKQLAMADHLLDLGADMDAKNNRGFSPLLYAVIMGKDYMTKSLIKRGADVNVRNNDGIIPLHSAASFGRTKMAKMMLEAGAKADACSPRGDTPLCWALNPQSLGTAKLLLAHGADVNHRDKNGNTPLLNACHRGNECIVSLFLEAGADLHAVTQDGRGAVTSAAMHPELLAYLLEKGAEVDPCPGKVKAMTAIHMAARRGNVESINLLVDHGAEVNCRVKDGYAPLHVACLSGQREVAKALLASKADPNMKEKMYGRTALHLASLRGWSELAGLLIDHGAKVELKDEKGKTPLEYALYHGFKGTADLLMDQGADRSVAKKWEAAPDLAHRKLGKGQAIVWYLDHSGWAIKTENHLLIFDYFLRPDQAAPCDATLAGGYVNPEELSDLPVTVFASHGHGDHYHDDIFKWKTGIKDIRYVLGLRPETVRPEEYTYMAPRCQKSMNGMNITTINSTDEGVGFLVEVDGLTIFHPGDHANREDGLTKDFKVEIDYLAAMNPAVDLSFHPVRGCGLGEMDQVSVGVRYSMKMLQPKVLFPMHSGNATHNYRTFAEMITTKGCDTRVTCVVDNGDRFFYKGGALAFNL